LNFLNYAENNTIKIIAKPNSPKTEIISWDDEKKALKVNVKAEPEKGKANKEIIKFFSKLSKKEVKIISGKTSKQKLLRFG
jgi:uncharacterized protein (TIGR00251 family)